MNERMFSQLKPEQLEELAEAGYRRRRREDLARAFQTDQHPTPTWRAFMARRPLFLLATGAVATVAAGAVVISTGVLSGTSDGGGSSIAANSSPATQSTATQSTAGDTGASPAATRIDARSFLLAAADTALREPATSGNYWYVRTRESMSTYAMPDEYWPEFRKLQQQEQAEVDKIDTEKEGDKLVEINEKYNKKIQELHDSFYPDGPPYEAYRIQTEERWRPKRPGNTDRVKTSEYKIEFASPQDEAKWKELGSPNLLRSGPGEGGSNPSPEKSSNTQDTNLPRPLSIANMDITMQNVGKLPTTKKALSDRLNAQFKKSSSVNKEYDLYLWQTTVDLMTAPTTPGTRAALYQVLAEQSDIVSSGEVTDATGRKGVGLSVKSDDGHEFGLVIDENTAELLEYSVEGDDNRTRVTFEELGWTDKLGKRP